MINVSVSDENKSNSICTVMAAQGLSPRALLSNVLTFVGTSFLVPVKYGLNLKSLGTSLEFHSNFQ